MAWKLGKCQRYIQLFLLQCGIQINSLSSKWTFIFQIHSTGLFHAIYSTFSKMLLNMIFKTNMVIFLFLLLFGTSRLSSVEDDIVKFLEDQGLEELSADFVSEEIEVWQLPSIPDDFLVQLGVTTMGARLRLRSAATTWLTQERGQVQDTGSGQVCAIIF